jgi:hypothetical protein
MTWGGLSGNVPEMSGHNYNVSKILFSEPQRMRKPATNRNKIRNVRGDPGRIKSFFSTRQNYLLLLGRESPPDVIVLYYCAP